MVGILDLQMLQETPALVPNVHSQKCYKYATEKIVWIHKTRVDKSVYLCNTFSN